MGYGSYSHAAHAAITSARASLPRQAVFKQTTCHPLMNPHGIRYRESRDSAAHPASLGVVFALDVSGSMGDIADTIARQEMPAFMQSLMDCGVADPQVLFMAVGDAYADSAPLQVGQFESEAEKMDQWLTWSFLEGGGGSLGSESYELALYFAARHIDMDCTRKRGKRGYLFMTGDELPYPRVSRQQVSALLGDDLSDDLPVEVLIEEVQRSFEPFFLIPDLKRRARCERPWRDLMGDNVIAMEDPAHACAVAAGLVALCEGVTPTLDALADRLKAQGMDRRKLGGVMRALTPYATATGRAALPALEQAIVPDGGPHRS